MARLRTTGAIVALSISTCLVACSEPATADPQRQVAAKTDPGMVSHAAATPDAHSRPDGPVRPSSGETPGEATDPPSPDTGRDPMQPEAAPPSDDGVQKDRSLDPDAPTPLEGAPPEVVPPDVAPEKDAADPPPRPE